MGTIVENVQSMNVKVKKQAMAENVKVLENVEVLVEKPLVNGFSFSTVCYSFEIT